MSSSSAGREPLPRQSVLPYYWRLFEALSPACQKCGYGGSLRRRTPEVTDLEMICLPFSKPSVPNSPLSETLSLLLESRFLQWDQVNKKNGERYKRFVLPALADVDSPGIGVDLFLADADNYGYTLMLRTGCAAFSHAMVTSRAKGGLRPESLSCKDGYVWRRAATADGEPVKEKVSLPTEERLFRAWDLPYIPAVDRSAESILDMRHALGLPPMPALWMTDPAKSGAVEAPVHDRLEAFA